MSRVPAMFLDEILQSVRIGLRPHGAAAQTGVALRIKRCAMSHGKGQETKPIRSEQDLCEEITVCGLEPSFCHLRSSTFEAPRRWQRLRRHSLRTFPARVELIVNLLFAFGTGPHKRVRLQRINPDALSGAPTLKHECKYCGPRRFHCGES